jgi:hypothetical protein
MLTNLLSIMMKSRRKLLLFSFAIFLVLHACNDDLEEGVHIEEPALITPDLTAKITASVAGFIIDESGNPVASANVTAGDKQAVSDEYGYFEISNTPLAKFAGQVKVAKTGYFDGHKTFQPQDKETFLRLKLLTKAKIGIIDAASGGTVTTDDGGTVTLSANSVVTAEGNVPYTGEVHVYARTINNAEDSNFQSDRPGDARGTNKDGYAKALKSFSTIAVELSGTNGEALQIMEGKLATINLPVPSALAADAPSIIDLWSFDKGTGLWKQEGTATKTGDKYVGSVSHFSFWDGAEGFPLVNFSALIVDGASQPLANVPVRITIAGMPKNGGHGRFGYTDANGHITGAVFANANLVLDILTPCALSAYSHEFSTAAADIDLGTLTGNLGQSVVTLSGTVSDCNNQPVTNGYVQTYDNGFYNRIAVNNGSFSFTGLACTNTSVNFVAVDNTTQEQNEPQTVGLNAGANDLGALTACATSTLGYISYTFDGVTTVNIQEPVDTIAGYSLEGTVTQVLTLSGDPNTGQKMAFQFDGGSEVGTEHKLTEVFSVAFTSGRGYWPVPVTVTITEYGGVGGFISGEFSSNMLDFNDNSLHTLTCNFRVRRNH